jgi:heme A synthase
MIGLTSLAIWLQGLWAGLFIREGKDFDATSAQSRWVEVHDWGARIAIVLALASLAVAVWRLRVRSDLLVGIAALFILLLVEAYIGGEIGDHASWPRFHIPLAMALMGLSVWLPARAARIGGVSRRDP